jgi:PmbA protein
MIGKKKIKKIIDCALKTTKADQAEVVVFSNQQALSRFANNYIHQNVSETDSVIAIRVAFGKKVGSASTNSLELEKVRECVRWAEQIAHHQRANEDFTSFPQVKQNAYRDVETFVKKTAQFSNIARAEAVREIVDVAKNSGLTSYGSVSNGSAEICISNSHDTFAYAICDDVYCNIVMAGSDSTGYAQAGRRDVDEVDFRKLARKAAQKALRSQHPKELPAGRYTTVFEPMAAKEFFEYPSYYAFNGRLFEEGRSFLSGKLGSKVFDNRITIVDDPFAKRGFSFPFDFEGVPKKRLVLVDNGIARNVVYDSLTAGKVGKKNTGHALSAPNPFGPVPTHVTVKGGDQDLNSIIGQTKRGILVTRFHYTNVIDPHKLTFTGMTRDGTFLIEDGEITHGIRNMRFTENIAECLNRLGSISKATTLIASEPGYGSRFAIGTITPILVVKDFNFTSTTKF